MTNEHVDTDVCLVLLKDIIARWPKANDEDIETYRVALGSYLADSFEDVDLHNRIEAVASISSIERTNEGVQIDFYDVDECLQRAAFESLRESEWRLKSLKFQCPVCFGEGVNDGDECDMCGGTGWGAS